MSSADETEREARGVQEITEEGKKQAQSNLNSATTAPKVTGKVIQRQNCIFVRTASVFQHCEENDPEW